MFLEWIFLVILVEALTNIVSKSDIFEPIRRYCFKSNNRILLFFHKLLDCPYCTSVWVAVFIIFMYYLYTYKKLPFILTLFFMSIILHRLANIFHFIADRIDSNHVVIGNGTYLKEETEDEGIHKK